MGLIAASRAPCCSVIVRRWPKGRLCLDLDRLEWCGPRGAEWDAAIPSSLLQALGRRAPESVMRVCQLLAPLSDPLGPWRDEVLCPGVARGGLMLLDTARNSFHHVLGRVHLLLPSLGSCRARRMDRLR